MYFVKSSFYSPEYSVWDCPLSCSMMQRQKPGHVPSSFNSVPSRQSAVLSGGPAAPRVGAPAYALAMPLPGPAHRRQQAL